MDELKIAKVGSSEAGERDALVAATTRYVKTIAGPFDFMVKVEKLEAGFARVSAQDTANQLEAIHGYAQRDKLGGWKILAMGTFFDAEFFAANAIPKGVQL